MLDPESPTPKSVIPLSARLTPKTRQLMGRIAAALAVIGIFLGAILLRDHIKQFAVYGYPGVFLASLIVNATIILPLSIDPIVFVVGGALNPLGVGIAAGLGAALGEMTGYLAGVVGQIVVENRELYNRIERWMRKGGILVIFVLGFIPNPVFDVGGMIAGASKMPVWQFLLATWAGRSIRFTLLALSGQFLLGS